MNVSVGLVEGRPAIEMEFIGPFRDATGKVYPPGRSWAGAKAEKRSGSLGEGEELGGLFPREELHDDSLALAQAAG